jgi:hypothetical protein
MASPRTPKDRKHERRLWVESTASGLLSDCDGLSPVGRVQEIGPLLRARLEPARIRIGGAWEFQRVDAAVDVRFGDASLGLAFLAWLGVCPVRRWKQVRYGGVVPESVEFIAGRTTAFCAYDAGVCRGSGPPGRLIRLERRFRFTGSARPQLEARWDWAADWLGGLDAMVDLPQMLLSIDQAQLRVLDLEAGGAVSGRRADGLLAGLSRIATGTIASGPRGRLLRDLATVGVQPAPGWLDQSSVPAGAILQLAEAAWGERLAV